MNAKKLHTSCTQMRRMLIKHGTMNINTGEHTPTYEEWVTRPCGVPMFSPVEQERGTCRSCANGWTHEHNYPVNE